MIGAFKKLSSEKKLALYFSLLTSLVLKIFSQKLCSDDDENNDVNSLYGV